jgi:hypothetical protein
MQLVPPCSAIGRRKARAVLRLRRAAAHQVVEPQSFRTRCSNKRYRFSTQIFFNTNFKNTKFVTPKNF